MAAVVVIGFGVVQLSSCVRSEAADDDLEPVEIEETEEPAYYDPDTDYMTLMIRYAENGDAKSLQKAIDERNAKIEAEQIDAEPLTVETFLDNFENYSGFALNHNYLADLADACLTGDEQSGMEAERLRNLKIDTLESSAEKISYRDLFLLSKLIMAEAGSSWLSLEWKMMVGEVLLNRVESPEFPNTIEECIYQEGQYYSRYNYYFTYLLPSEACVEAAVRLLSGEKLIADGSVVFQANFTQGNGVYLRLYDATLGHTYLCYSSNPELYEGD